MSTTFTTPSERIANDPYWVRQFSVAEYHKMIDCGILGPDDRVELLEGWIVNKPPQSPPRASSISRVIRWLGRVLPPTWTLGCHGPITLSESEPEPDISLARGEIGTYDKRHPGRADIGILMDVADSALLADRRYRGELYAGEKIAEFWLINLVERKIEVHTRPRAGKYQKKVEYPESDTVTLILDGVKIAAIPVTELIPKS